VTDALASLALLAQDAASPQAAAAQSSALLAAGFVLLAVALVMGFAELFVPTAGVLAVGTAVCLVASVVVFFMHSAVWGFAALLAYSAGAPFALVIGFKVWSRSPIARRMVLGGTSEPGEDGAPAATAAAEAGVRPGDRGVALTGLRPVGFARIGEARIEVTAEFGLVDAGAEVEVTAVSGDRVTVRAHG
jgi:membrane-bound serine protease (ClpP class)